MGFIDAYKFVVAAAKLIQHYICVMIAASRLTLENYEVRNLKFGSNLLARKLKRSSY